MRYYWFDFRIILLMKTIEEIRAERLNLLLRQHGMDKLAELVSLHPKTIEHWINTNSNYDDVYSMTSQDARRIEAALNLERGWLDQQFRPGDLITYAPMQSINNDTPYLLAQKYESSPDDKSDFIQFQLLDIKSIFGKDFNAVYRHDVRLVDISKKWAYTHLGYNIEHIALITVVGDAMSPSFNDSDVLFIDTSVNHYLNEGVYCFFGETQVLTVKRLQKLTNGDIRVISDNHTRYTSEIVSKDALDDIRICGKVIATWALKPI